MYLMEHFEALILQWSSLTMNINAGWSTVASSSCLQWWCHLPLLTFPKRPLCWPTITGLGRSKPHFSSDSFVEQNILVSRWHARRERRQPSYAHDKKSTLCKSCFPRYTHWCFVVPDLLSRYLHTYEWDPQIGPRRAAVHSQLWALWLSLKRFHHGMGINLKCEWMGTCNRNSKAHGIQRAQDPTGHPSCMSPP